MENKKDELLKEVKKLETQLKQIESSLDGVLEVVKGKEDDKIRTYINGFDEAMGGGIEKKHIVLISGTPGALKSSLALSILYNNLKNKGLKGLYLSLEESKESLLKTMEVLNLVDFDKNDLKIIDIGRMRTEHEEAAEEKDWFRIIKEYLKKKVQADNVSLIALDSLTALYSLSNAANMRNELFHFFNFLRDLGVTSFLITESQSNGSSVMQGDEDYLSDGLISLGCYEANGTVSWRIRCVKLRHSNHSLNYFTLDNNNGVFAVHPENSGGSNKDL
jgi:KaiC/GvpD/RAD55 family RecA-like ATPase